MLQRTNIIAHHIKVVTKPPRTNLSHCQCSLQVYLDYTNKKMMYKNKNSMYTFCNDPLELVKN